MQLPTFAFPADPLLLALVPAAPAVKEEKSFASIGEWPVAPVQLRDAVDGRGQ